MSRDVVLNRPADLCIALLFKVGAAEVRPLALGDVDGAEGRRG